MAREHTAEIFDVTAFIEAEERPVKTIPLESGHAWKVRAEPVNFGVNDSPLAWALTREGALVRIPLIPYRVKTDPPETLLGAMDVLQRCIEQVPNAVRTHIIVGTPVEDLRPNIDTFRFWLGFAARIQ